MVVVYVVFMVVLSTFMTIVILRVNNTDCYCDFVTLWVPGVDEEGLVSFMKNNLSVYLENLMPAFNTFFKRKMLTNFAVLF